MGGAADAMAWALVHSGDALAAQPFVERALRLGSTDTSFHYHAALVAEATGDRARARDEISWVLARNPSFSFSQRDEAVALAARLGVPAVPPAP